MKTMKKILAMICAMVMIMALALPVMAEETINPVAEPATYEITIMGSTSNQNVESAKGHTYEAYQILSGTVDQDIANAGGNATVKLGDVAWGANIDSAKLLEELKKDNSFGAGTANLFSAVTTAQEFVDVISATSFTSDYVEKLAHILNKCITGEPVDTTTETEPPYTLQVPAGYYLIKDQDNSLEDETDVDKDYTDIILEVSKKVTINHKGSVPTVTKTASELNNNYRDVVVSANATTVYFKLEGTLPSDFDDYSSYAYKFVDTMSEGLELDGNTSEVKVYALYNDGTEVQLEPSSVAYEPQTRTLTVEMEDLKHNNNEHNFVPGNKIIVIYKAKLNENAVIVGAGNPNEVYLEYSNNPNGTGTGITSSDEATVYTFGIQIHKYDGENVTKNLENVKFRLFRKVRGAGDDTTLYPEYAIINAEGVITGWSTTEDDATEVLTDAEGLLHIHGLDTSVYYYLEETETNAGYNRIQEPIEFMLTPTLDEQGNTTGIEARPSRYYVSTANSYTVIENGEEVILGVTLEISNDQGVHLPTTGGMGTTLFYVLGSVLAIGAVILLVTKKRMAH